MTNAYVTISALGRETRVPIRPGPVMVMSDFHGCFGPVNTVLNKRRPAVLVVCGDFGYWPSCEGTDKVGPERIGASAGRKWSLSGFNPGDTLVLAAPGNHEEWTALEVLWERGETSFLPGTHMMPPGSSADIFGVRTVFVGGARSDQADREGIPGEEWFEEEIVAPDDVFGIDEAHVVVSHTAPERFIKSAKRSHWSRYPASFRNGVSLDRRRPGRSDDPSCVPLEALFRKVSPKMWFFGHFHEHASGTDGGCDWMCVNMPGNTGGAIVFNKKDWEAIPSKGVL